MLNSLVRVSRRIEWNKAQTLQSMTSAGESTTGVPRPEACHDLNTPVTAADRARSSERLDREEAQGPQQQPQLPPESQTGQKKTTRCSGGRGESRFDHEGFYCEECDHPERQHVTNPTPTPQTFQSAPLSTASSIRLPPNNFTHS